MCSIAQYREITIGLICTTQNGLCQFFNGNIMG